MKYFTTLLALIIFPLIIFAQHSEKEKKIQSYLNFLQLHKTSSYEAFENMSEKEFTQLVKLAYSAIEIGTPELNDIADIEYYTTFNNFLQVVRTRYSNMLVTLIRIPIFVKAEVKGIEEVNKGGFRQINLKLKPEFVVKGKEGFLNQTEFEVFHRYYNYVPDSIDYKTGKSYLFPLWDRGEEENEIFAVATWIDLYEARFLVEDNILYDRSNFFNMGTKVEWQDFIERFNLLVNKIIYESDLNIFINPIKTNRY
jgi:hypothetical protein